MNKYKLLLFLSVIFSINSCKDSGRKTDISKVLTEWIGKEIQFPDNVPCFVSGHDTIEHLCCDNLQKEYKILLFVDSTGCSECRLKLLEWKQLIIEADRLFQGKVGFLFFFQPKNVIEMKYMFYQNKFIHPVFIDIKLEINVLNNFPLEQQYQCFLLDNENKVLLIGNPVMNPKIWELFKIQISRGK